MDGRTGIKVRPNETQQLQTTATAESDAMKFYLRTPERHETAVHLNLVPKAGENIEYGGERYMVVSVLHSVETAKTVLEVVRVGQEIPFRTLAFNEHARFRTSEIRAYSTPTRLRISGAY